MSTSSTDGQEEDTSAPSAPPSYLKRARSLLHTLGKRPTKSLGQHFLVDTGVLGKIVGAADLTSRDVVIEVGPGLGILTEELARRAGKVIAVELDIALVTFLREALASYNNVTVYQADILKTDPSDLLVEQGELSTRQGDGGGHGYLPYKVVANLPYNIASAVLRRFLEARDKPQIMIVMVQREVARRITARPGDMSPLSVGVQLYGHPSIVHTVSPRSFFPVPKVHSAVIRIDVYAKPAVDIPAIDFFRVVRAGFSQPRKQLRNSLAAGLGLGHADSVSLLSQAGIDPQRRAETLSLPEWGAVATAASGVLPGEKKPLSE